ncbi:MAG: squalene synthase HpnC [Gammaproteobacteria bacterium]
MKRLNTASAYKYCQRIAKGHYENFPVASILLPKRMRLPIAAIYAFARTADDWADEGDLSNDERLQALDNMAQDIMDTYQGNPPNDPIYIALADSMQRFNLPVSLFNDLISAFKQDVTQKRFADFGELMNYCRRSANPVGRLLLHLYGLTDRKSLGYSDALCSALQLINFYQDLDQDYHELGRIYIPEDEMAASFVSEDHFKQKRSDGPMMQLMRKQFQRANKLLNSGAPLGKRLKGRFGLEIRLITAAASRVMQRLDQQQHDLFSRPRLKPLDWIWIVWTALRAK